MRAEIRTRNVQLTAGGQQQVVRARITNNGPAEATGPVLNVQVPLTSRGVSVAGASVSCGPVNGPSVLACQLPPMAVGESHEFTLGLNPPGQSELNDGETVTEVGNIWVTNPNSEDPNNKNDGGSFNATASAPAAGVREVSGTVVNTATSQGIEGVSVVIKDSAGSQGDVTTDASGRFSYRPDERAKLKPGRITLKAAKDGFDAGSTVVNASSGGSVDGIQLAITPVAASPSPSPTPQSPSAAPTVAPSTAAGSGDDEGSGSLMLIVIISALAAAILAGGGLWIALRRNRDSEPPVPPGLPDSPTVQLSRDQLSNVFSGAPGPGGYPGADATRVYQPGGSTQVMPGADSTQVYQPTSGTEPYQPASGTEPYQPASGAAPYQPASGAGAYASAPGTGAYPPPPYPPTPGAGLYPPSGNHASPQPAPGAAGYPPAPGTFPPASGYPPGPTAPQAPTSGAGYAPQGATQMYPPPGGTQPYPTGADHTAPAQETTAFTPPATSGTYRLAGAGDTGPLGGGGGTAPFTAAPTTSSPAQAQADTSPAPFGPPGDDDSYLTEGARPARWLHAVPPPEKGETHRGRHSAD